MPAKRDAPAASSSSAGPPRGPPRRAAAKAASVWRVERSKETEEGDHEADTGSEFSSDEDDDVPTAGPQKGDADGDGGDDDDDDEATASSGAARSMKKAKSSKTSKHAADWCPVGEMLHPSVVDFHHPHPRSPPSHIKDLRGRVQWCMDQFFSEEMFDLMQKETNLYAQKHKSAREWARRVTEEPVTLDDIKRWFAVRMSMGLLRGTTQASYYSSSFPYLVEGQHPLGKQRFMDISAAIHCQTDAASPAPFPNDTATTASAYRVENEPKIGKLLGLFLANIKRVLDEGFYPLPRDLSLDEAMVRFQGIFRKVFHRQPKPTSEGIKFVCLCTPCGFLVDFLLEAGPGRGMPGEEVVKYFGGRCAEGTRLYMDNYFSSAAVFLELAKKKVLAAGTVRANRGAPTSTELAKGAQPGVYRCAMAPTSIPGINMVGVTWMDSGVTRFLSTVHDGSDSSVLRKVKGKPQRQKRPAPLVAREYNEKMHGVDLADQKRAVLTIQQRTIKWWKALLAYIFDSAIINAHLLFEHCFPGELERRAFFVELCRAWAGIPAQGTPVASPSAAGPAPELRAPFVSCLGGIADGASVGHVLAHFKVAGGGQDGHRDCALCRQLGKKAGSAKTDYVCASCQKSYHIECYSIFHLKKRVELVDGELKFE